MVTLQLIKDRSDYVDNAMVVDDMKKDTISRTSTLDIYANLLINVIALQSPKSNKASHFHAYLLLFV